MFSTLELPGERLSRRTADRLVADLRAGAAAPGDRLPSERALTERYGVSRVTVRAALKELAARGMVAPSASRGWFVTDEGAPASDAGAPANPPSTPASAVRAAGDPSRRIALRGGPQVLGFADFAARHGLSVRAEVLEHVTRPASHEEAARLRIAPSAEIVDLTRVRFLDDLVVVIERNRLPLSLCPALAATDFRTASLYATLRAADPPQLPAMAEYALEARRADAEECRLLEMDPEIPLLVAEQLAFNQDARPLEWTIATYRGDRYRFSASIADADGSAT